MSPLLVDKCILGKSCSSINGPLLLFSSRLLAPKEPAPSRLAHGPPAAPATPLLVGAHVGHPWPGHVLAVLVPRAVPVTLANGFGPAPEPRAVSGLALSVHEAESAVGVFLPALVGDVGEVEVAAVVAGRAIRVHFATLS